MDGELAGYQSSHRLLNGADNGHLSAGLDALVDTVGQRGHVAGALVDHISAHGRAENFLNLTGQVGRTPWS